MSEPILDLSPSPGDSVKTTTCYMCACRCGIKVWLKDGKLRYIQGNPAHPVNRGVLCAKGAAGIMQHYSPARLKKPLLRVGERGAGEFREIEWDEALSIAAGWLGAIRERNPDELAFFTGRDQSQALTGWWAQQFGTINYAAHGGFCSVNMAAAGLYTLGGSFWEFGEPDWEHTRYLMLWGVAEDHDSNPIKLGLGQLKARGAKIVAINPVRTGYGAIADEWVGIRPGTDGLLAFALIHELLRCDRIDLDYLVRYSNAHWLVIRDPGASDDGLFARDEQGRALCAVRKSEPSPPTPLPVGEGSEGRATHAGTQFVPADRTGIAPLVVGEYTLPDGRLAVPALHLVVERYLDPQYAPAAVAERCGVPAATIRRLAQELAQAAFDSNLRLPIRWTDVHGVEHAEMIGRPVAMHAMRGISAHSNGFHTCRALHLLQLLLGAVDTPGSFRYQPPYPRPIPPANRPGKSRRADGSLDAGPLGFIHGPEDLLVDENGQPRRIDHAFSWAYPLAAHGMMHTVIRNAWAGDPYPIDTLFLFMANMSWNSSMNTTQTMHWLTDKHANGEYRIPHIIYADAYASEMVAYADLVLPDTTYLERFDAISLLDRPISDADGVADALRHPVLAPETESGAREVRGFQSVLLELGARLKLPGMVTADGAPSYHDYADYIVRHDPDQLKRYIDNGGFWRAEVPLAGRYYKMANRDYLHWAQGMGLIAKAEPITLQVYCETLQKFRLAGQGHGLHTPPAEHRERVVRYFDPLPLWYEPLEGAAESANAWPLSAISQRPMFMYHAWGAQNAWLRQIATRNYLYLHPDTAARFGVGDDDWVALSSQHSQIVVPVRLAANVQPDTVWTWNAIGKRRGAWRLSKDAPESKQGFLLNHLIDDLLPDGSYANADPITGQAAWFDLRVSLQRVEAPDAQSHPQFAALKFAKAPGELTRSNRIGRR
ncbi:MAG: formate dehydrogenase [Gammaproteobacteria bacterium HGW-Gammaproteobacteria-2]|nr:MAG: formate dehydrogenase [Gammaproteobacteria bacterium HGW-Gammaproteobacteria-2]